MFKDKRLLFLFISACIMILICFIVLTSYYYKGGNPYHSPVTFTIQSEEDVEYILKVEPMEVPQYSQRVMMYNENQEAMDKDMHLRLTKNRKIEGILEDELPYRIKVFQTELTEEPEEYYTLHEYLGELIHTEEISVNRRSSFTISVE